MDRNEALQIASNIIMLNRTENLNCCICGSLRRGDKEVGDIDILILDKDLKDWKNSLKNKGKIYADGKSGFDILYRDVQVNFRAVPVDSWGSGLLYLTGSGSFNLKCRSIAKWKGYKLNRYGLWKGCEKVSSDEKEILRILDLEEFIDPRMR